jgi:uncharacterized protein
MLRRLPSLGGVMQADLFSLSLLLVASTLLLAGTVKGLFGLGLPAISMGLLGLIMPPVQAAALLVVPTLVTNAWQLAGGPALRAVLTRFGNMVVPFFIGTLLSIRLLTGQSPALATALLGLVLALYAVVGLSSLHWSVPRHREQWCSPVVALLTGLVNGATGISAIPLVPYLASLDLEPEELIQVMGLSFTTLMLALATGLAWTGNLHWDSAGHSALALLPVAIGMLIGQGVRRRLSAVAFKRWFFVGLLALGSYTGWRGLAVLLAGGAG